MAVYAIGDVQGCFDELQTLLDRVGFNPGADRLWFAGDLVNRGPKSLETLRFIRGLGNAAVSVLGNHDLHLLALAHDLPLDKDDHTMDAILVAPDRDELVDWLCHRPLLHHDDDLGYTLLHAGLPPQWDLHAARQHAHEVESMLKSTQRALFLEEMYGNKPKQWNEDLKGWDRLRFIVNCFTRLRFCDEEGRLDLSSKGPPGTQQDGYRPWFEVKKRRSRDLKIIFGHWSALSFGEHDPTGVYPVDTGCLWGGALTALRIDQGPERIVLPCKGEMLPTL